MDADDIANVDRLKKQYEFMEVNKDIDLIGTSVDFIDENAIYPFLIFSLLNVHIPIIVFNTWNTSALMKRIHI
ncbi:MAG: hypothetical protein ACRCSD_02780 [Clostridium sp.]